MILVVGASHSGSDVAWEAASEHDVVLAGKDTGQIPAPIESRRGRLGFRLLFLRVVLVWNGLASEPPALRARCHTSYIEIATPLCSATLRDGSSCRSVPTAGDLCEHHARLAAELGRDSVLNGDHAKTRNARQRVPVTAESEPLELRSHASDRPSAVRPALALTAAEEVETIRRVLLEAATSTSRQSWATCTCPECGKGFRQEISVPDHGARIKAVETLLREGLGRVGEAEVAEPRMPRTVAEVEALSWSEMKFIFAISYAQAISAFVDDGDEALRAEVERWEPETREAVGRALAEVA